MASVLVHLQLSQQLLLGLKLLTRQLFPRAEGVGVRLGEELPGLPVVVALKQRGALGLQLCEGEV